MDSFITGQSYEWPTEVGNYWFYGYRYKKFFGSSKNDKELMFVTVVKISNGLMVTADGQMMCEDDLEEAKFIKATTPELPTS
jgi:hypothetical protein